MSTDKINRSFDDKPATREQTPVLVGLIGPSGSGKTFSALRLATGMQRVAGGDIFAIDTEARRMLAYADKFRFRHLPFGAPFSPLDYLAAIEHCVKKGAKTLVIDSMSHEHEGPGGVLEMHEKEMGGDFKKQMLAWAKPKAQRRRLINSILQLPVNVVFCFRAKEKLKIQPGKDPVPLGFMAIGGDEWIYEMTMSALLMPNSRGIPTWKSDMIGERQSIKLPGQFEEMFPKPEQITEEHGEKMARWAAGAPAAVAVPVDDLIGSYRACSDAATYRKLEEQRGAGWSQLGKADKAALKQASDDAKKRVDAAVVVPAPAPEPAAGDQPAEESAPAA